MIPKFKLDVLVDWGAYWKKFQELHGGDPVSYKGRMLFRDGWTYSPRNVRGPEWPPPPELGQLISLVREYWNIRKNLVTVELTQLRHTMEGLRELQAVRSAPIQQMVRYFDKESKKLITECKDLDLTLFNGRIQWLEADLNDCVERLKEVGLCLREHSYSGNLPKVV